MDGLETFASCSGSGGPGASEAVLIPTPEDSQSSGNEVSHYASTDQTSPIFCPAQKKKQNKTWIQINLFYIYILSYIYSSKSTFILLLSTSKLIS